MVYSSFLTLTFFDLHFYYTTFCKKINGEKIRKIAEILK